MTKKSRIWIWALLALFAVIPRLPWLALPLENDSGANAFLARHILHGEHLYNEFHTAHHLPGIYYTFALAFKLFGDNPQAPKILLFFFVAATCWIIYLIGREHLDDELSGILGAVFYALVSSQELFSGTTAAIEHFANLPITISIFLLLYSLKKNSPTSTFFWAGIISSIAILFKIVYAAPLATIGIILLAKAWTDRGQSGAKKILFSGIAATALGFILPLALVGGYFASLGLWNRLMLVFTLGFSYFSNSELSDLVFPRPFGFPLFITAVNNAALLVFGLIGTYRLTRSALPLKGAKNLVALTLVIWLILSFASTGIRGGGYEHYVLIVLPPLALIAGFEISSARLRLQATTSPKSATIVAGGMTALIVLLFLTANMKLYTQYFQYLTGSTNDTKNPFITLNQQKPAEYIKSHTQPEEYIYLWGNNVQLYYYADRNPPIDILWPDYVSATGGPERIFNENTKYIIVDPELPVPQWLSAGLTNQYTLETVVSGWDFYKRK